MSIEQLKLRDAHLAMHYLLNMKLENYQVSYMNKLSKRLGNCINNTYDYNFH